MVLYSTKEPPHFPGPVISVRNPTVCLCVKDESWTGPATHRKSEKERQFAEGRVGEGAGVEPNHTTARKIGPI